VLKIVVIVFNKWTLSQKAVELILNTPMVCPVVGWERWGATTRREVTMRTIARCFLLFGLVAVVPRVAAAQATLAGEVKDPTGAVLPGVSVEAASPALIEKIR